MKEFEKWQKTRGVKTIGFLDGNSAYRAGEREGWEAALEMVKREIFEHRDALDVIEEELEQ